MQAKVLKALQIAEYKINGLVSTGWPLVMLVKVSHMFLQFGPTEVWHQVLNKCGLAIQKTLKVCSSIMI